jgi:hypothetical protein
LSDQDAVEIEYQTRREDVRSEILSMSVIREIGVNMYKERSRVPNQVRMVTEVRLDREPNRFSFSARKSEIHCRNEVERLVRKKFPVRLIAVCS